MRIDPPNEERKLLQLKETSFLSTQQACHACRTAFSGELKMTLDSALEGVPIIKECEDSKEVDSVLGTYTKVSP